MAIILTNTAKYDPFNFQELAAPYILVDKAAGEVMDTIDELGSKADLMKKYADEDPDSPYAKQYYKYNNELEQAASDMAKYGMSAAIRNNVRGLKRRYSAEIDPIDQAAKIRKERADEQRKLKAANPNLMFDIDWSNINLGKVIDNPNLGYTSINGDDLYKKGAVAGKSISSTMISDPEVKRTLGNQYYQLTRVYGMTPAEAYTQLSNSDSNLSKAVKRIAAESGINILSENDQNKAVNFIIDGVMGGLTYDKKIEYKENKNFETPAHKLAKEKFDWEKTHPKNTGETEKDKKTKSILDRFPTITLGVEEVSKVDDKLLDLEKNLMIDSSGNITTSEIQSIKKQYEEANDRYLKESSKERKVSPTGDLLSYSDYKNPESKKRQEASILKGMEETRDRLLKSLNQKQLELSNIHKKYAHLSTDPLTAVTLGISLEKSQSKTSNSAIVLTTNKSDAGNIKHGIDNLLNAGAQLIDEEGRLVSEDNIQQFIEDDKHPYSVIVTRGKDPKLLIKYDGETFKLDGIDFVNNINNAMSMMERHLRDYSKEGIETDPNDPNDRVYEIDDNSLSLIYKGSPEVVLNSAITNNQTLRGKDLGNGYTLYKMYNDKYRDYVKVLTKNGTVVGATTLQSEINGGTHYSYYLDNFIQKALSGIQDAVN